MVEWSGQLVHHLVGAQDKVLPVGTFPGEEGGKTLRRDEARRSLNGCASDLHPGDAGPVQPWGGQDALREGTVPQPILPERDIHRGQRGSPEEGKLGNALKRAPQPQVGKAYSLDPQARGPS